VIAGANSLRVALSNHATYTASVVGVEPEKDIAVLRISAPPNLLRPIVIGESADLMVGQKVFAIGNPFGLDQTLTTGIVSALGRSIQAMGGARIEEMIQTDAAINPGNSGGPLLDSAGRLIGVNTAIYSPSGASAGIGFAVPVDIVNNVVPQIIQHGRVTRPRLGVVLAPENVMRQLNVEGVLILSVETGSPSEAAGLRGTRQLEDGSIAFGDVIQEAGGTRITSQSDLLQFLDTQQPGDEIELTVLRGGEQVKVRVRL
jgi:S1-C subfamily serine protease